MQIRLLEEKTGLDRATIRFYEREGLICPKRAENGYREYSEEEANSLLKIRLLRQLGMSLDQIRDLQQGKGELQAAAADQLRNLDQQKQVLDRAGQVCQEIRDTGVSYDALDAGFYLEQLRRPAVGPAKTEFRERVPRSYHPWRRYFARMLDYTVLGVLLRFLVIVVLRVRPMEDFLSAVITYGAPFLAVPINGFFLHKFGTTPMKWLFSLKVTAENGENLSFSNAVRREWRVQGEGLGYGIPFYSWWRVYQSYRSYQNGEMDWEEGSEYHYGAWTGRRKAALAVVLILAELAAVWNSVELTRPTYRGDLTAAQFASNYNDYLFLLKEGHTRSDRLQSDGSWYPENDNVVVVHIGGQPEPAFQFETEGERLTKITYTNTWTDVTYLRPISGDCMMAAITAAMSQSGSDLSEFLKLWETLSVGTGGELEYNGVTMRWRIESENCRLLDTEHYTALDDSKESTVTLIFEIDMP